MNAVKYSTLRRPSWLKVQAVRGDKFQELKKLLQEFNLNTVCEKANCPNIFECFPAKTATFLILGDSCTRRCGFCLISSGEPQEVDSDEPYRVAQAVAELNLRYVVITSVTRDDLVDGGAETFGETVRLIRKYNLSCKVEVLVPDFGGSYEALQKVTTAGPDVFAHNLETVPRLYLRVRPHSRYPRSLELLRTAKELLPNSLTKSGIILGFGEKKKEIIQVMKDLREADCDLLTLGQYLSPSRNHLPVARYYHPQEFEELKLEAIKRGFLDVEAGPLVRSSYHAQSATRLL